MIEQQRIAREEDNKEGWTQQQMRSAGLRMGSGPVGLGGLPWELEGLDAEEGAIFVDGVVDIGQVLEGGPLSDSAELVVDGAVADADPAIVGPQVRDGNAAQMGADRRADQHLGVASCTQHNFLPLVQDGFDRVVVFLVDLELGEPPHEHGSAVPDNLDHLARGQFRDVHFHVGVAVVASPAVETPDQRDGQQPHEVEDTAEVDGREGVDLGAPDVGLVLVVDPVLIEPVVDRGREVDVVAEVARPR